MPSHTDPLFDRAAGCLMGQIAGDSLGGLVEFWFPGHHPRTLSRWSRLLEDGGTWNILAGQPTDDSEMALMLARLLPEAVEYDAEEARRRYLFWLESGPSTWPGPSPWACAGIPTRTARPTALSCV